MAALFFAASVIFVTASLCLCLSPISQKEGIDSWHTYDLLDKHSQSASKMALVIAVILAFIPIIFNF